jgi:hypothetical protein
MVDVTHSRWLYVLFHLGLVVGLLGLHCPSSTAAGDVDTAAGAFSI